MLRAMIVEDNISFRELFKGSLLSQYPSMEVIEAGSGEEALRRVSSYPFDLIFMDIGLPGENGLQIARKIKAQWHDLPIIILTSYDLPEYRKAAIACGANSFIAKDAVKWDEISALVKCHGDAKYDGRKPACIRLANE